MADEMTLLKKLLMNRHMETHRAFRLEYDKVARRLDKRLIASAPGREQFGRWLAGRVKTKPSVDRCRVLEHMFPGYRVAELLAPYDPEKETPGVSDPPSDDQEATTTNRRQVFQLGAATLTTGLISTLTHGPDQLEQVLDATSVGDTKLAFLEAETERLGVRVCHLANAAVLAEVLVHFSAVRELLRNRQPLATQRRLARVGAKLSIVMGEILFALNQPILARRWWRTALHAAQETGDSHLVNTAIADSTYLPVYSGSPHDVLAQVMPRLEMATKATPSVAWMWGFAALAHAKLGNRDDFERAINLSRNTLSRCDPDAIKPGVFSFLPRKQAFFEARGRADLGDTEGAGVAAARALPEYEPTSQTDPALVRFAHASALAKSGELEEACRLAVEAIHKLPTAPAQAVVIRAHDLNALFDSKGYASYEWREAMATLRVPHLTSPSSTPLGEL